ncbi:MAG: type II secretion system protein [Candidatus Paceibacterota bacterium]
MIKNKFNNKGFSLVELLIYIGIFAASAVFLVSILIIFTRIHVRQTSVNEVNSQVSFVNNFIQNKVREASLIDMNAGISTTTINLRMASSTMDPTLIYWEDETVFFKEGSNDPIPLTNSNVSISDFSVVKYQNPGGHDIAQVHLTVNYNTDNSRAEYQRSIRTAISRVSAATFDSDILPNQGNSFDIGNSSQNWRDAYFSGHIGVGTTPVSSASIKVTDDISFTQSDIGVILVAPDSSCFRISIDNAGALSTSSVACP